MNPPRQIAPSILAADFTRLGEQIQAVAAAGADLLHIDVMDGRFVPNISMGPLVVAAARRVTTLPLDVHLMIVEPDHLLPAFAQAGANSITVHWEACVHLHRTLQSIKALGCRTGVAINPHTPVSLLADILPQCDQVLVMTVNPGFGGQRFIPETLPKIRALRTMIAERDLSIVVGVDGGINTETAAAVAAAGADIFIAGTTLFSGDIPANLQALRNVLLPTGF